MILSVQGTGNSFVTYTYFVETTMKTLFIVALAIAGAGHLYGQSAYQTKQTTLSDVDLYISNYGILGNNTAKSSAGLIYPRGSQNQYLFGSGIWFGAKKRVNNTLTPLVALTYNPNSGYSWMTPGNSDDPYPLPNDMNIKYHVERSTEFTPDGLHIQNQMPPWSLWKTADAPTGVYVPTISERNSAVYPKGAAMVSDEMFHSRYHDNNLNRYEGGSTLRGQEGFPLGLQFDEKIFTWNKVPLRSSIIVQQSITNTSNDTLFDCHIGHVFDPDISTLNNAQGAQNDNIRPMNIDNLNGVYAWSSSNQGEQGKNFGYLAITHLETPAVNDDALRTVKSYTQPAPYSEQVGISAIRFFDIQTDPITNNDRYNFMSENKKDGEKLQADIRALLSTGAFTLLPGQTARVAYCITIVNPIKGNETTGSDEDFPAVRSAITENQQQYINGTVANIEDNNEQSTWTLAPNPAHNSVTVAGLLNNDIVRVQAISVLGEIFPVEYTVLSTESVQCSLAHLPQGYYTLLITASNQTYSMPLHSIK